MEKDPRDELIARLNRDVEDEHDAERRRLLKQAEQAKWDGNRKAVIAMLRGR